MEFDWVREGGTRNVADPVLPEYAEVSDPVAAAQEQRLREVHVPNMNAGGLGGIVVLVLIGGALFLRVMKGRRPGPPSHNPKVRAETMRCVLKPKPQRRSATKR